MKGLWGGLQLGLSWASLVLLVCWPRPWTGWQVCAEVCSGILLMEASLLWSTCPCTPYPGRLQAWVTAWRERHTCRNHGAARGAGPAAE